MMRWLAGFCCGVLAAGGVAGAGEGDLTAALLLVRAGQVEGYAAGLRGEHFGEHLAAAGSPRLDEQLGAIGWAAGFASAVCPAVLAADDPWCADNPPPVCR